MWCDTNMGGLFCLLNSRHLNLKSSRFQAMWLISRWLGAVRQDYGRDSAAGCLPTDACSAVESATEPIASRTFVIRAGRYASLRRRSHYGSNNSLLPTALARLTEFPIAIYSVDCILVYVVLCSNKPVAILACSFRETEIVLY